MFSTGIGLVLKGFEISQRQNIPGNELIPKPVQKENPKEAQKEKTSIGSSVSKKLSGLFTGSWKIDSFTDWMKDGEDFDQDK
jgi:hypothetical protein